MFIILVIHLIYLNRNCNNLSNILALLEAESFGFLAIVSVKVEFLGLFNFIL